MNEIVYLLTPFVAWLVTGIIKFVINTIKVGRDSVSLIGYGGMPSNHSSIVSSMAALIALREGLGSPYFGIAITLAFIVILDAASLRKQIGKQASVINKLQGQNQTKLRESIGHTRLEIFAGILVGIVLALLMNLLFSS